MLLRIVFLVFLPIFFLSSAEHHSIGPIPAWVKKIEMADQPVSSDLHVQYLLLDNQKNDLEKTDYMHVVERILTPMGVQARSRIEFKFQPMHQQIVVHEIRLFRAGKWEDRLANAPHRLVQKEKLHDQYIYEGELSLIYFLEDVREGDIIEYAFSVSGVHPVFEGYFWDTVSKDWRFRLLTSPELVFQTKGGNCEPTVVDISPSVREWTWEKVNSKMELTQFKNWGEVAQVCTPLFELPEGFEKSCAAEMRKLAEGWLRAAKDEVQAALSAVRFVQNEVRYLAFVDDAFAGFKPRDPSVTFRSRYGDCKDKTFLLQGLLRLMGIQSTAVLVDVFDGDKLSEMVPSPNFNHVILRIEMGDEHYWVDSTHSHQGGNFLVSCNSDLHWGLVLSNETTDLVKIPNCDAEKPIQIETVLQFKSESEVELNITKTFYDEEADQARALVETVGKETLAATELSNLQMQYGEVEVLVPFAVQDDRVNNIVTLSRAYKVGLEELSLDVISHVVRDFLEDVVNPKSKSPFELTYPLWVKEHICVEAPFCAGDDSEIVYENDYLFFRRAAKQEGNQMHYYFELKHLQDHVPVTSIRDYWNLMKKINQAAFIGVGSE